MCLDPAVPGEEPAEDYSGCSLRDRLELLAFDARLAGVPRALLVALWEAIDRLRSGETGRPKPGLRRPQGQALASDRLQLELIDGTR
jgi:hypothetical protein